MPISIRVTKDNNPDYVGNVPVNYTPDTASVWIDYTFQTGPLDGLMLGAGVRYIGESYGTFDNEWTWGVNQFSGLPSIVPDYTLVDAAIRYDFEEVPQPQGVGALGQRDEPVRRGLCGRLHERVELLLRHGADRLRRHAELQILIVPPAAGMTKLGPSRRVLLAGMAGTGASLCASRSPLAPARASSRWRRR